jgi:hypothetical protein
MTSITLDDLLRQNRMRFAVSIIRASELIGQMGIPGAAYVLPVRVFACI